MNLIVGATGLLGGEICQQLAAAGRPVRAFLRATSDPAKAERLENLNVELAQGDLKDGSSLRAACRGITAVISTASSTLSRQEGDSIETVDRRGQLNLIDAAKAAGVAHFIYVSFQHLGIEFPLESAKREVEQRLKESGLTYTILQPTFFMEVWLSPALGFDAAGARAQIYGSGLNRISWISYRDVAKFAVASLDNPEAKNSVIKLGGPEALSPLEVVRTFEDLKTQKFDVQHVPEEALRAQKAETSDPLQESFAALMLYYAQGDVIDMQDTLRKFPVRLTSVRDYARHVMSEG
ncbi:MAG: SDR family oxidoreductase [Acidobacteria bacterium]|nr:SDR family oxidoreductase [Acidobacteriota bacterium]